MSQSKHGDQFDPDRKEKATGLDAAAGSYYRDCWDVHNIARVEGGIYDNYSGDKDVFQLLDYASIDTIIDTFDKQYGVHERWIMPNQNGTRFALRSSTGSDVCPEADKFLKSVNDVQMLTPGVAAYGKANGECTGFEWFRIVDLVSFKSKWGDGEIRPSKVWDGSDGTSALLFDTHDLEEHDLLIGRWGEIE